MAKNNLQFKDNNGQNSAILGTLEGPCADFLAPTRNDRFYSEELWEKTFKDPIVTELIENGGIPGELDHPEDREETDSSRIAILMKEKPTKKNGKLWAKFDILDTPLGKIAYTLAKAGFKLGISSRGSGDVYTNEEGKDVVDEDTYDFKAFDLVLLPAVKSARLNLVTEGLTKKLSLRESFIQILNESTQEEKELITSTINDLGVLKEQQDYQPSRNLKGQTIQVVYTDKNDKEHIVYFKCDKNYKSLDSEQLITAIKSTYSDVSDIINISESLEQNVSENVYTLAYIDENGKELTKSYSLNKDEIIGVFYSLVDTYSNNDSSIAELRVSDSRGNVFLSAKKVDGEWNISKEQYSSDNTDVLNKQSQEDSLEAEDDGSELLTELQECLKFNKELTNQVKKLQEELSVCYAKELSAKEKIDRQKQSIQQLTESKQKVETLNAEIKQIKDEISNLNEQLEQKEKSFNLLSEKYKIQSENQNQLKQKLEKGSQKYKKLYNDASTIIEKLKTKANNLIDDKQRLNEQIEELNIQHKKDLLLKESQAAKELHKQQDITEKYKENTRIAVNRYIQLQAEKVGCKPEEIKSRLNESYSFKDIDNICNEYQKYQLNFSKLPVDINRSRVRITEAQDTRRMINSEEIIDRDHLIMAGLL